MRTLLVPLLIYCYHDRPEPSGFFTVPTAPFTARRSLSAKPFTGPRVASSSFLPYPSLEEPRLGCVAQMQVVEAGLDRRHASCQTETLLMSVAFASLLAVETGHLVLELHQVLTDLDPARWKQPWAKDLHQKLADIRARAIALIEGALPGKALKERLAVLEGVLAAHVPIASAADRRDRWMDLQRRLQPAYEDLARGLREYAVHVPALRPTNYARNLFHLASATVAAAVIVLWPTHMFELALGFAAAGWFMEASRRIHPRINEFYLVFFRPVAYPHEHHRVNSATWYATSLVILAATGAPPVCVVAVTVLGLGDPVAAIVGRRWGRHKLLHGRSLEGTAAFIVVSAAGVLGVLLLFFPTIGLAGSVALALGGSVVGALAELLSKRIDDNISIPLSAAAGSGIVALLLGNVL